MFHKYFLVKINNKTKFNFDFILLQKRIMRQLKGKVKESRKEKRERKEDNKKNKDALFTIVLPTLAGLTILIAAFVYFNTR